MASRTIYPPIVKDYEPAFIAGNDAKLRMYFNLSSLSKSLGDNFSIHASIIRKDGVQVVNLENDTTNNIYRATGTILNLVPHKISAGYYYVDIDNNNLKSDWTYDGTTYHGWIPGWSYKVQLRISKIACPSNRVNQQEAWLQENSELFSEWSTICFIKCISPMEVINYNKNYVPVGETPTQGTNDRIFSATIQSIIPDIEDYYSCNITLYKCDNLDNIINTPIEQSGEIFNNEISNSAVRYTYKTEFEEGVKYVVYVNYITENDYRPLLPTAFVFRFSESAEGSTKVKLLTVENLTENAEIDALITDVSSLGLEEDEGRIGLKIYYDTEAEGSNTFTSFLIRRASSKDNFAIWEDIKYITVDENTATAINQYPIVYDYTVESGIWYKYGVAGVAADGKRSNLNILNNPVIRLFEYSYILGENEKQLKLEFDNTISTFTPKVVDGQQEPIGSKYPFVGRNSVINYKSFSITGLITFWLDEANTFLKNGKEDIFYPEVIALYENFNLSRNIRQYDYTYEREFRKKVMEFLNDGKPKLFKSPSEGNIIVRLKDINLTPNQAIGRLIYSFNANALEIDDDNMYNYLKYGFYYPGTYRTQ